MMKAERMWHVLYTAPKTEVKVAKALRDIGFSAYVPKTVKWGRAHRRRSRSLVKVTLPAYPRYVFVSAPGQGVDWEAIHDTRGVIGIVCIGGQPAKLTQRKIEAIMAAEDMGCFDMTVGPKVDIGGMPMLVGAEVVLAGGPLAGLAGKLVSLPKVRAPEARVVVEIRVLGQCRSVSVPLDNLRSVA